MKPFNSYQQLHFTAIYGPENVTAKITRWTLMEASKPVLSNMEYAACAGRKSMVQQGAKAKFLKIVPYVNKAIS